jgi:hypothetical protein
MQKKCCRCKELLPESAFAIEKRTKNGLTGCCKECHNTRKKFNAQDKYDMNKNKFNAIYLNLPAATQKTFKAVPISSQWTIGQIQAELMRTGSQKSHQDVSGIINALVEHGLVKEPLRGKFIRAVAFAIPEDKPKLSTQIAVQSTASIDSKTTFNPIKIIADFADRASQIEALAFNLKNDIEIAAVYIQEEFEKLENKPAPQIDAKAFLEGLLKQVS